MKISSFQSRCKAKKDPAKWTHEYFQNLFAWDWEMTKSPAGATQWIPKRTADVWLDRVAGGPRG